MFGYFFYPEHCTVDNPIYQVSKLLNLIPAISSASFFKVVSSSLQGNGTDFPRKLKSIPAHPFF